MPFNSFAFLLFFGVVVALYYAVPHRWRWPVLLAASLYFYSALDVRYLALVAYSTLAAYVAGLALAGRGGTGGGRLALAAAIVVLVAALGVFKYANFLAASAEPLVGQALPRLDVVLAAGLSFYTFSCIAYVVDCYRGTLSPERHLGRFALYVAFFPKLLAGPIERAAPFLAQLAQPVRWDHDRVASGLWLVLWDSSRRSSSPTVSASSSIRASS